jgi:hypothetical protein
MAPNSLMRMEHHADRAAGGAGLHFQSIWLEKEVGWLCPSAFTPSDRLKRSIQ